MDEELLGIETAACCRMLEYLGLIDFSGHVSARIGETETILINPREVSRNQVTPRDIVRANLDGEPLDEGALPPDEVYIHTEIYQARPDVKAVAHLHPPAVITLSVAGKEFRPVIYHGSIFAAGVPVLDDCRHVNTPARGRTLAAVLGQARAAIIRGHGAVTAAPSIRAVFFASVYLEDNARKLLEAYRIGEPQFLREEELDDDRIWKRQKFGKVWDYYRAKAGINFA